MKAYYFTEARWALDNLRHRRVKVSVLSELNDPFELLALDLSNSQHRQAYVGAVEYCVNRYGVLCLSRSYSNPLLWGHYGERHRGICLGFDVQDDLLMPINYELERVRPDIERALEAGGDLQPVVHRVFSTKFRDWAYEEEVRAWINLEERDETTGLFFADFSPHLQLREVVLGVRCQIPFSEVLAAVSGLESVRVSGTRLSLGSFCVEKVESATGAA